MQGLEESFHGGGHRGFPWSHVMGYLLSLLLTVAALWWVEASKGSARSTGILILSFAALQILVQLFFFMHVTESRGPRYHVMALAIGLFFVATVVLGSIWIMSFGAYQAY